MNSSTDLQSTFHIPYKNNFSDWEVESFLKLIPGNNGSIKSRFSTSGVSKQFPLEKTVTTKPFYSLSFEHIIDQSIERVFFHYQSFPKDKLELESLRKHVVF